MDQARELVGALPGMFLGSLMHVLLQAGVHVRENKAAKAEEILGQYADKFPDRSKVILLARAQVTAAAGHLQIAADSLVKIPDIQHKPATVSTIVSLKERAGDTDGADAVFDSAIKWWSNAMTEDNKLNTIMQEAAAFKLRHGRKEEAAHLYGQLVKSHGSKVQMLVPLKHTEGRLRIRRRKRGRESQNIQRALTQLIQDLHPIQRGGFPRGRGLVTDQRERIREQLKLEVLKVQWLKRQRAIVIRSQTSQLIQKEPLRMQCNRRLHPNLNFEICCKQIDTPSGTKSVIHLFSHKSNMPQNLKGGRMHTSSSVFEFIKSTLRQAMKQGTFVDIEILWDSTRRVQFQFGFYKRCSTPVKVLGGYPP
ncbi:hypothetical protein KY290_000947 [Solanum tuberosum]|uniref:Uncharacterized protein n=1 Tax=Solanum tuberosum TaxID=4113 RepID=A0ABQ7WMS0_SOLTU|nr:hypothetical protein KY290_000947 [Solanum tuberosum]